MSARLYLVTPPALAIDVVAERLGALLAAAPVACVRIALDATADQAAWTRAANILLPICHEADVALVLTDHYRMVPSLGLDGVHLASSRAQVREVRDMLGQDAIIGAFAGTSRHQGLILAEAGADYVSFGPVRSDEGLGDGDLAGAELFEWWNQMIEVPSVAEGGVSLREADRLSRIVDFAVPDHGIWDKGGAAELAAFAEALPPFD